MKNIIAFLALAVCVLLVFFSPECMAAARNGVDIWWNTLLPTLFPFFVCATLIERSGALHKLANFFYPASKTLRLSNYALPLLFLGGMTGYPSGARLCGMLQSSGSVSESEAERLGTVCNLASPMFLSGALAEGMLGDHSLFGAIAISHYGGALIIALALSLFAPIAPSSPNRVRIFKEEPLSRLLPETLISCMSDITKVGGSVIFFLVLAELMSQTGIVGLIGLPPAKGIILGIFEMTGGVSIIAKEGLPLIISIPICAFLVSFGGLSVMVQAMGFTQFKKPQKYMLTKLAHGFLAAAIAYAIMINRPGSAEVFSSGAQRYAANTLSGLATLFACTLGVGAAFVFSIIVGKLGKRRSLDQR